MSTKIEHSDLQFSYFRLVQQKLNEDPKGVMVMHMPTGNSALSTTHSSRIDNKQEALKFLYAKMGVPFDEWEKAKNCHICNHRLVPVLAGWTVDYSYSIKVKDAVLQVYEVTDEDENYWIWHGTAGDRLEAGGDPYETAAGAAAAAIEWANSLPTDDDETPLKGSANGTKQE